MKTSIIWFAIFAILVMAFVLTKALMRSKRSRGFIVSRNPLTKHEQPMYWRLVEAFPPGQYVVLAQVGFGALLTARRGASRNVFSQKIADFVVTDRSFTVLAIIELDDSSHTRKKESDETRDSLLTAAGYKVIRYKAIPAADTLRKDLAGGGRPSGSPGVERKLEPTLNA